MVESVLHYLCTSVPISHLLSMFMRLRGLLRDCEIAVNLYLKLYCSRCSSWPVYGELQQAGNWNKHEDGSPQLMSAMMCGTELINQEAANIFITTFILANINLFNKQAHQEYLELLTANISGCFNNERCFKLNFKSRWFRNFLLWTNITPRWLEIYLVYSSNRFIT